MRSKPDLLPGLRAALRDLKLAGCENVRWACSGLYARAICCIATDRIKARIAREQAKERKGKRK